MGDVSAKVKVDFAPLIKGLMGLGTDAALGQVLANTAKLGMSPYVPFRTGTLDSSAIASPFRVTYGPLPYARRVYYGINMRIHTDYHALATSDWPDHWQAADPGKLGKTTAAYIKKVIN